MPFSNQYSVPQKQPEEKYAYLRFSGIIFVSSLFSLIFEDSLFNFSLHDIKELINNLGGNKKTILSFAGVGDLLLTATSEKSRNYTYGVLLGKNDMKEALNYINETTVEGYYTLNSIYSLLRKKEVKMPVIDIIYDIVINGNDPKILVDFLMKK